MKNIVRAAQWLFADPEQDKQLAGLSAFQTAATLTLKEYAMKLSDLTAQVHAVDEQLTKAKAEILAKIDELTTALADMEIPPEAVEALAALATTAQGLDDIVPDAPVAAEPVA